MWRIFNLVFYSLFTLCSAYFAVVGDISYATYCAVLMFYCKYTLDQEK